MESAEVRGVRRGLLGRLGNPRSWRDVDKCIIIALATVPFPALFGVLADVFQGRPWLANYAAQDFLPTEIRGAVLTAHR